MKHLLKKLSLRGGGGSKKPKVTPAKLEPPKLGSFEFATSYSFTETLDLISDGPIEGLVNQNGIVLDGGHISQGVYLDNTPVAITNDDLVLGNQSDSDSTSVVTDITIDNSDISEISNIFTEIDNKGFFAKATVETAFRVYQFRNQQRRYITFLGHKFKNITLIDGCFDQPAGRSVFYNTQKGDEGWSEPGDFQKEDDQTNLVYTENQAFNYIDLISSTQPSPNNLIYFGVSSKNDDSSTSFISYPYHAINRSFGKGGSNPNLAKNLLNSEKNPFLKIKTSYDEAKNSGNVYQSETIDKIMKVAAGEEWNTYSSADLLQKILPISIQLGKIVVFFQFVGSLNESLLDADNNLKNVFFEPQDSSGNRIECDTKNFLIPQINADGDLIGALGGIFFLLDIDTPAPPSSLSVSNSAPTETKYVTSTQNFTLTKNPLKNLDRIGLIERSDPKYNAEYFNRYNFANVLLEQRKGYPSQLPFRNFNKIHIDKIYNKNLYGPYRLSSNPKDDLGVQRIDSSSTAYRNAVENDSFQANSDKLNVKDLPSEEYSHDQRSDNQSFSDWAKDISLNEEAIVSSHVIDNPNTTEYFVTLQVNSLFDTADKVTRVEQPVGTKTPAIVNIEIEDGIISSNGQKNPKNSYSFSVIAIVESTTLIDIGRYVGEDKRLLSKFHTLRQYSTSSKYKWDTKFVLQKAAEGEKRYVEVKKLSTETNSVLIEKDISLAKITEVIDCNFNYPYSAIIASKLDTRSFGSIPERTFDAKLKKIQIPTNYFPTFKNGKDKRYYVKEDDFTNTTKEDTLIYKGDWNGNFKIGWTDNPAWILYDLLTNNRYGLGQYIDQENVNKWELYKIARFCDSVDDNGYFVGTPDGQGGLEPRYSCNILLNRNDKLFDTIQNISSLFRGKTFFRNSEITFTDERLKDPIATFSNVDVKDGVFNYASKRRDQQFNTIEVAYLDRFENFAPKIEFEEDEEDIRQRGVFKKRIDTLGVTSKSMAKRIAKHILFSSINENQTIAFTAGLEALLCQPSDLISIQDDLKSNKINFGKVLAVNRDKQIVRLSGPYDASLMNSNVTFYNPTGYETISGLSDTAATIRERITGFSITNFDSSFNVDYGFSGYTSGFSDAGDGSQFGQYALYTGSNPGPNRSIIYFSTGFTGWVFATGEAFQDNPDQDKYINTGYIYHNLTHLNDTVNALVNYDTGQIDRRGSSSSDIQNDFSSDINNPFGGILPSEILLNSPSQIITLAVIGEVGASGEIGSYISGVDLPQYLDFIKLGSPYKYEIKDTSESIFKITSIKEENINEYLVSATKFETGKFELIENDVSIEPLTNTYVYQQQATVNDVTYDKLSTPANVSVTSAAGTNRGFKLNGSWDSVSNNNGYYTELIWPNGRISSKETNSNSVSYDDIENIGNFTLRVQAIGDPASNPRYFNSNFGTDNIFALYEDLNVFTQPFISNFNFI